MLELRDLITDPPGGAIICPKCKGYGVVVAWEGSLSGDDLAQSSADCPICDCKGWILKEVEP